jgi:hypothetical protein
MVKGTIILILGILFVLIITFAMSIRGCGVYGRRGYYRPPGLFYFGPRVYNEPVPTGTVRGGSIGGRTYRGGGIGGGK